MYKCKLENCEFESESRRAFIYHIKNVHKLDIKEYFEVYENVIQKCMYCDNQAKWNIKTNSFLTTCDNAECKIKYKHDRSVVELEKKYGVTNASQIEGSRDKMKSTKKQRYGNENYTNQELRKQTSMTNWGVDNVAKSLEIKERIKIGISKIDKAKQVELQQETNLKLYGVKCTFNRPELIEETRQKNLLIYGEDHPMKNKDYYETIYKQNIKNLHGVDNVSQLDSTNAKVKFTKFENRKFRLLSKFGNIISSFPDPYSVEIHCEKCGQNSILNTDFLMQRNKFDTDLCLHCTPYNISSYAQIELNEYIQSELNIQTITNHKIPDTNLEIDVYISELNIGIEYNGIYFHSEKFKSQHYHYDKWMACIKSGIKLITIWEDDWRYNKDLIKSMIKNQLGLNEIRIFARKSELRMVSSEESSNFLINNHIQGNCNSNINIGLYHDNILVSLMTFTKKRMVLHSKSKTEFDFELLRFCTVKNTNVIGAASKLFSYFINTYNPDTIVSYANLDIGDGKLYQMLGFENLGWTGVNYWWCKNKRQHRSNFMKHKLVKEGFDPNKTEAEIMYERGYSKIYGIGNLKFEWNKNKQIN